MKPLLIRRCWDQFARSFPRLACEIDLWRRNKYFEEDLWQVPNFLRKDMQAVDVGVNAGIFSLWMSKFASRVISFECNPHLVKKLNGFLPKNVTLHACALSSASGETTLRFDPDNTGIGTIESKNRLDNNPGIRHIVETKVSMRTLDEFQLQQVSFMKIDVEGHELEVLKGAATLLSIQKPTLLIEIEERHCAGNVERVPQWLSQFGYQTHCYDRTSGKIELVDNASQRASAGVNNFWFIPR